MSRNGAATFGELVPQDVQAKVRKFFELYDPDRLESSDFNVLLRYIANRGIPALEDKLLKKYGVNIASMEKEQKHPSRAISQAIPQLQQNQGPPAISSQRGAPQNQGPSAVFSMKSKRMGTMEEEKELSELDNLPPPPEPTIPSEEVAFRKRDVQSMQIQQTMGMAPDTQTMEDAARAELFQRLTNFYRAYNQERLLQGIGNVVEFALRKGVDKINKKLMDTYGEDLETFEAKERTVRRESARVEMKQMKEEEQNVGKMDPDRQRLRQELIDFFLAVEPARAEIPMDPLLDYAGKHGEQKLNEKLFKKYGSNLVQKPNAVPADNIQARVSVPIREPEYPGTHKSGQPQPRFDPELRTLKKGDLPEYVRMMLGRYYAKYDPVMLEDGGVDAVYEWTKRNGLEKLNRKLGERYGQSLQEFIRMANELRDDLIDFYRHTDKNKLVHGIQPILDWGLRNGRVALNEKLRSKYGISLDQAEIYQDVMESASQF